MSKFLTGVPLSNKTKFIKLGTHRIKVERSHKTSTTYVKELIVSHI